MEREVCIRLRSDRQQIESCKVFLRDKEEAIASLANLFQLAGNAVRLKIAFLLHREGELCVCDISDILSMNIAAISQHLRKLKDRQLVITRRSGQTIYYRLTSKTEVFLDPYVEDLIEDNHFIPNL